MKNPLITSLLCLIILATGCYSRNGNTSGKSTPIDSTNVNGTSSAVYGPDNPADDTLSINNVGDTGTKANNVHHTGFDKETK